MQPTLAFTDTKVSAMTTTASLGNSLDLNSLWDAVEVPHHDGTIAIRHVSGAHCKPDGAMDVGGKPFGNQLTALVQVKDRNNAIANVKVFGNGTLQMTGVKSMAESRTVAFAIKAVLGLPSDPFDFRARMVNVNLRVSPPPMRSKIVHYINSETPLTALFDPSISHCAKLYICFNTSDPERLARHSGGCKCEAHCAFAKSNARRCFRCIALIHKTGTITIRGACGEDHIKRAEKITKEAIVQYVSAQSMAQFT